MVRVRSGRYMCWLIKRAMSMTVRSYLQLGQVFWIWLFAPTLSATPQWQQKYVSDCPLSVNWLITSSTLLWRTGLTLAFFCASSAFSFMPIFSYSSAALSNRPVNSNFLIRAFAMLVGSGSVLK